MSSLGLRSGLRPGKTTSKLLEKVSKQLRGDYAGKGAGASDSDFNGEDEDDGVSSYLKMLSEKTAKQPQKTDANNAGDDDSDGELTKKTPVKSAAAVSSNRFLKKPSTPTATEKQASTLSSAKTELSKGKAVGQSPTLHMVEAFTKKYGRSSNVPEPEPTSDSDLDLSLSMDEDILADVKALKKNRPASSVDSVASLKSAAESLPKKPKKSPQRNDEEDSGSVKIGKSGNRFLKTPISTSEVKASEITPQESKRVESPVKGKQRSSLFRLESAARHSTEVVLDSDEESLAEFIGGLSGGSSGRRTPSKTKSKDSIKSSVHVKQKESETDDNGDKSISEADPDSFKFNIQDLESLQDMTKTMTEVHQKSTSVTPPKNTVVNQFRSARGRDVQERSVSLGRKKEQADDVLGQFGLHSVDDLLGMTKDDDYVEALPVSEALYESDFDFVPSTSRGISPMPLRSILSPTPRSMTPRSSRSRVRLMDELTEIRSRSPSPETPKSASRASNLTRSETVRTVTDSESEIERTIRTIDESNARNTSDESDTEETSTVKTVSDGDSVSSFDRMSATRRSRRRIQRRSSSSRRSSTASDRFYSDDFTNTTSPGSESQSTSRRSSYTDDLDSQRSTPVSTDSKDRSRHTMRKVKTREAEVQTGLDVGLHYHWVNDLASEAWTSAQYRQAFTDPAKVATSVVSAEALDALTNFSPATLALNDMLRQQLQLTTQFMTVHRRLHYTLIQSLDSPAYKYTTLKETKEFIRKHSRPVASFEETLEQVKHEMGIV